MELKKTEKKLSIEVSIPPHKFHVYNEYIDKHIKQYENIPYNQDYGLIYKILSIDDVNVRNINKNSEKGDVVFEIITTVECFIPRVNDAIPCKIIQNNNIVIATNNIVKIIILEDENFNKLAVDDIVNIEILCFEINKENIKIVGKYLNHLN